MDLELKGKVAVIGGASKGLGRACAEVLAAEGATLALCSRSQLELEKTAQQIRDATGADVLTFAGDLDRAETVRDLIAATATRFGRLDILVNNSGGPPLARAHNATEDQWATAVQRSLLFFARMCREAVPHLRLEIVLHQPLRDQRGLRQRAPYLLGRMRHQPLFDNRLRGRGAIGH